MLELALVNLAMASAVANGFTPYDPARAGGTRFHDGTGARPPRTSTDWEG